MTAAETLSHRVLDRVPEVLSSTPVIMLGIGLFFYLVVFAGAAALLGHPGAVSVQQQLILGNYTNVSSSVGAGIAAGLGIQARRERRKNHVMTAEIHALLQRVHPERPSVEPVA